MSQTRSKGDSNDPRNDHGLPNMIRNGAPRPVTNRVEPAKEVRTRKIRAEKAKCRKSDKYVVPWAIVEEG